MTIKIMLQKKASGLNYSIEAGLTDNCCNFDHHGEFRHCVSPCNNVAIPAIRDIEAIIEISHIDADTLVGIRRLMMCELPNVDLRLMERIDLNGSSICSDKFNQTLLYMVGIGEYAREIKFPRCSDEPQDVTSFINHLLNCTVDGLVHIGRIATEESEATYKNCLRSRSGNYGLWSIGAEDPFDPSRPYEDGIDVVVVYREHYKSISIYCNPLSDYQFAGKTLYGIQFAGHPKACGSPRGQEMTYGQAIDVFDIIS